MIGLEVAINGKRLFVASLPEGAVTATVATVQRHIARRPGRPKPGTRGSAMLAVTGYVETPTAHEFPWSGPDHCMTQRRFTCSRRRP